MNYCGINAKICALNGRLLSLDDYEKLSRLKTVVDIGAELNESKIYSKFTDTIKDNEMHREEIEQKIVMSLYDNYSHIYKFICDYNIRKFLDSFFLKHEIHVLKLVLCMIYDERGIDYTLPELNELLGNKLNIDVAKLKDAKTIPEAIDTLEGTEFFNILNNVYKEDVPLSTLETQLDLYYYLQLWDAKDKYLDKQNAEIVHQLIGTEIDLNNILWIRRLKKYYNMQSHLIYTYLIPLNYNLSKDTLRAMCETGSVEELHIKVLDSYYGAAFKEENSYENIFHKEISKVYKATEKAHPKSLANVLSYIFFKETEIKRLTNLIEGVRYELDPSDIMKLITLSENKEVG